MAALSGGFDGNVCAGEEGSAEVRVQSYELSAEVRVQSDE
jgi:hypothetical protein